MMTVQEMVRGLVRDAARAAWEARERASEDQQEAARAGGRPVRGGS